MENPDLSKLDKISSFNFHASSGRSRSEMSAYPATRRLTNKLIEFDVEINNIKVRPDHFIAPLRFEDCVFSENVEIWPEESAGPVLFKNCTFLKHLTYRQKFNDDLKSCKFNSRLTLYIPEKSANEDILISDLTVFDLFTISGQANTFKLLNINNGCDSYQTTIAIKIEAKFVQLAYLTCALLSIIESRTEFSFALSESPVSKLMVVNSSLSGTSRISNCKIEELILEPGEAVESIFQIDSTPIQTFNLNSFAFKNITISNEYLGNLCITETTNVDTVINLNNLKIQDLRFDEFINRGLVSLRDVEIIKGGRLSFILSNLAKTDFISCKFSEAQMEFENSKISEIFLSDTTFPSNVYLKDQISFSQGQLAFSQIVSAYQKQGDTINALEYNSRELEAHYRKILQAVKRDPFTIFNLWLNKVSNDFGRQWFRGILFSLGLGLLFFSLLVLSTDKYGFKGSFDKTLGIAFLKFMNPLRFFDLPDLFNGTRYEGKIALKGISYFLDFFGRVTIAYGFYQTIQAFRRFGRK